MSWSKTSSVASWNCARSSGATCVRSDCSTAELRQLATAERQSSLLKALGCAPSRDSSAIAERCEHWNSGRTPRSCCEPARTQRGRGRVEARVGAPAAEAHLRHECVVRPRQQVALDHLLELLRVALDL
jgi:hypothetical protein